MDILKKCNLCKRNCLVNRYKQVGYCKQTDKIRVAKAVLTYFEEPCISNSKGSGTIFFSGCNMRCIFCQNHDIASGLKGKVLSIENLANIMLKLQDKGANNINLVTPTHFTYGIIKALEIAKNKGLVIPIVYNTSSYENIDTLKDLSGLIDIYLPDFKYVSSALSSEYSNAKDYFEVAKLAVAEMVRQVGSPVFFEDKEINQFNAKNNLNLDYNLMKSGVIVRHLCMPGTTKDSKAVIKYLYETYKDDIFISIMNQYTPLPEVNNHPKLSRKLTKKEYNSVINYALDLGLTNGFIQEGDVASESFIPDFNFQGLL